MTGCTASAGRRFTWLRGCEPMSEIRRPCADCPWRKDAPPGHWRPDHFADIYRHCQDDGTHLMLCHHAVKLPESERGSLPCQGWVRAIGFDAIGVRLAVMTGKVSLAEVRDTGGPELYASFDEMMSADGVECPGRNRFVRED